jgi:hypothetical protein
MLNRRLAVAGVAGPLLMALAACGSSTDVRDARAHDMSDDNAAGTEAHAGAPQAAQDDLCHAVATSPSVRGDSASVELHRSVSTTAGSIDDWFNARAEAGAPSTSMENYPGLTNTTADAPITICVFKVDPRPIPVPAEVKTMADGVRVFVQSSDAFAIDAIGDVNRLSQQLDEIKD